MNQKLFMLIPGLTHEETVYLTEMTRDMEEQQLNTFASIYNGKRKSSDQILIFCLLGFVAVAGVHRIMLGQVGMGILYIFTGGLCFIGTIVDAVNHKQMTNDFNYKMAQESLGMVGMFPINR